MLELALKLSQSKAGEWEKSFAGFCDFIRSPPLLLHLQKSPTNTLDAMTFITVVYLLPLLLAALIIIIIIAWNLKLQLKREAY